MLRILASRFLLVFAFASPALAALPPLFDTTPRDLVSARVVVSYPTGTFLESVLALPDGDLLVNSHLDGLIHRVAPSTGASTLFARVPGTIAGLAATEDAAFLVSGWLDGQQPAVFHVSATGEVKTLLTLPDGQFPNGVTRLAPRRHLVADSYRGVIWEIDTTASPSPPQASPMASPSSSPRP